jgi:hypothetical protein
MDEDVDMDVDHNMSKHVDVKLTTAALYTQTVTLGMKRTSSGFHNTHDLSSNVPSVRFTIGSKGMYSNC